MSLTTTDMATATEEVVSCSKIEIS